MKRLCSVLSLVLGCVCFTGCTPDLVAPPVMTDAPTATQTPTPEYGEDVQKAIDAAYAYVEKWTFITQNVLTADWNEIYEVATDSAASTAFSLWGQWAAKGSRMVGEPTLSVDSAYFSVADERGRLYEINGCMDISEILWSDSEGNLENRRTTDRTPLRMEVLEKPSDGYLVSYESTVEGSC